MQYRELGRTGWKVSACDLPPISNEIMKAARSIYEQNTQRLVHHYW